MRTLDKDSRIKITKDVLVHAFQDRVDALLAEEGSIITAIIDRVYPAEIQAHMAALIEFAGKVPFAEQSRLTVNYAGQKMGVGAFRYDDEPRMVEIQLEKFIGWCGGKRPSVPILANWVTNDQVLLTMESGDELGERIVAYWAERRQLKDEINSRRGSIMGILAHIKNEAQLKAKWPEVMPIAEKHLRKAFVAGRELPALPTPDLNAVLKLPPKVETRELEEA